MSSRPNLRIDWCSHEAAKYAVEHWHYSRRMPVPPIFKVGVWESDQFIGSILFSRGANRAAGTQFGLSPLQICELVRVALRSHDAPVSRMVAIALRLLKTQNPGLRLVFSHADQEQGHHGGIYQAGNWTYIGRGRDMTEYFHQGRWKHEREMTGGAFGRSRKVTDFKALPSRVSRGKYKYLYPFDDDMRAKIAPLAKTYPKRPRAESIDADVPAFQVGEDGSLPISALHSDTAIHVGNSHA